MHIGNYSGVLSTLSMGSPKLGTWQTLSVLSRVLRVEVSVSEA